MSDQPEQIDELFASVAAYIAAAESKMQAGTIIELVDLGPMVDALCQRVLDLPRPVGEHYADELDRLIGSLDQLKSTMEQAKKRIAQEAKSLQKRQKALKLYSNTSTTTGEA